MSNSKILYVCEQIAPYLPENPTSLLCRTLLQAMQERGYDIRTFMPRYGSVNERRNQLHEVIRLSGMNLIIDDNDHQLIIKVASIPSARVQIYFIDNDDYFKRKFVLTDENDEYFEDNDERAIFFARGVIETVKKLRWQPDIVHCHGWFSSIVPICLRNNYADNPLFKDVKIVLSLYNDTFKGELNENFKAKIQSEGAESDNINLLDRPTYQNLIKFVMEYVDAIVIEDENLDSQLREFAEKSGKPILEYQDKSTTDYLEKYQSFYNAL
ncbi:MAG: glycogen/starch synthase [Rikenellaceae bacterium]